MFFFFKQKTAYEMRISDWSSDVCSSDLIATATASYGYGWSMNALHEVRAYSAIANDGLMPHLRLIKNAPPVPPQRAISAHTARELRRMLETEIGRAHV